MAATLYPLDEPKKRKSPPKGITVRFDEATLDRLEFMAQLFNAFDEARNQGGRKWLPTRIIRRAVKSEIEEFAKDIGGLPDDPEGRADLLARASEIASRLAKK